MSVKKHHLGVSCILYFNKKHLNENLHQVLLRGSNTLFFKTINEAIKATFQSRCVELNYLCEIENSFVASFNVCNWFFELGYCPTKLAVVLVNACFASKENLPLGCCDFLSASTMCIEEHLLKSKDAITFKFMPLSPIPYTCQGKKTINQIFNNNCTKSSFLKSFFSLQNDLVQVL